MKTIITYYYCTCIVQRLKYQCTTTFGFAIFLFQDSPRFLPLILRYSLPALPIVGRLSVGSNSELDVVDLFSRSFFSYSTASL